MIFAVTKRRGLCDKQLILETGKDQRVQEVSPMNKKSYGVPLCSESMGDCALAGGVGAAEALSSTHAPSLSPASFLSSPPLAADRPLEIRGGGGVVRAGSG